MPMRAPVYRVRWRHCSAPLFQAQAICASHVLAASTTVNGDCIPNRLSPLVRVDVMIGA
jgi:hypothetical protein